MNKKMIIGVVIVAAILLVTIIVLLLLAQRSAAPSATTTVSNDNATSTTNNATVDTSTAVVNNTTTTENTGDVNPTVVTDSKTSLYQTARFFTERYGSYSTDNEHENIDSLRSFMTDAMQTSADALIATQTNTASNEAVYYGVTTQAANIKMIDYTPTATGATVEVVARRIETTNGETQQYTQTARLQLKKINDAWKVDTFKWVKI